jgi:hypothetical protein
MLPSNAQPIYRNDDNELMGYVAQIGSMWNALTIFGYSFSVVEDQTAAKHKVLSEGLSIMSRIWQYYDQDEKAWFSCRIAEARSDHVTVIRTNVLGYEDSTTSKFYTIEHPDVSNFVFT